MYDEDFHKWRDVTDDIMAKDLPVFETPLEYDSGRFDITQDGLNFSFPRPKTAGELKAVQSPDTITLIKRELNDNQRWNNRTVATFTKSEIFSNVSHGVLSYDLGKSGQYGYITMDYKRDDSPIYVYTNENDYNRVVFKSHIRTAEPLPPIPFYDEGGKHRDIGRGQILCTDNDGTVSGVNTITLQDYDGNNVAGIVIEQQPESDFSEAERKFIFKDPDEGMGLVGWLCGLEDRMNSLEQLQGNFIGDILDIGLPIRSSTEGSGKMFVLTVNDAGELSAKEFIPPAPTEDTTS